MHIYSTELCAYFLFDIPQMYVVGKRIIVFPSRPPLHKSQLLAAFDDDTCSKYFTFLKNTCSCFFFLKSMPRQEKETKIKIVFNVSKIIKRCVPVRYDVY